MVMRVSSMVKAAEQQDQIHPIIKPFLKAMVTN